MAENFLLKRDVRAILANVATPDVNAAEVAALLRVIANKIDSAHPGSAPAFTDNLRSLASDFSKGPTIKVDDGGVIDGGELKP